MLVSEERCLTILWIRAKLSTVEWAWIEAIGLGYMAEMPHVRSYMTMLKALIERWRSKTMNLHLSNGEITINVEDMYWIYRLPIQGIKGISQRIEQSNVVRLLVGAGVHLHHGQLSLEQVLTHVSPKRRIYFYVCTLVSGYILLDRGERSIVLGMI